MDRIDSDTADKIRRILLLARSRGQDPVVALDLAGLLRHPVSMRRDYEATLVLIIESIREMHIPQEVKTPLDLKNHIVIGLQEARTHDRADQ